jgi:hypothetical protein
MKNKILLSLTAVILIFVGLQLLPNKPLDISSTKQQNQSVSLTIEKGINAAEHLKSTKINQVTEPEALQVEWIEQAIAQQITEIADTYKDNIRFPSYSKPLHNNDWNLLNPRPFVIKDKPLDVAENLSAAIILDHYIVHNNQDLAVKVRISGELADIQIQQVSIYFPAGNNPQQDNILSVTAQTSQQIIYSGILPSSSFSEIAEGEKRLLAHITFKESQAAKISTSFKLSDNKITLSHLGESYIEGPHLMIPAYFDIEEAGLYRLQANLFDQQSQQPISHLNSQFQLSESDSTALIKVHAVTLRAQGFSGPYRLSNINITRNPAHPGDKTGYGASAESSYIINGFDLSHYSDEEYINEANQKRLDFLNKMANSQ